MNKLRKWKISSILINGIAATSIWLIPTTTNTNSSSANLVAKTPITLTADQKISIQGSQVFNSTTLSYGSTTTNAAPSNNDILSYLEDVLIDRGVSDDILTVINDLVIPSYAANDTTVNITVNPHSRNFTGSITVNWTLTDTIALSDVIIDKRLNLMSEDSLPSAASFLREVKSLSDNSALNINQVTVDMSGGSWDSTDSIDGSQGVWKVRISAAPMSTVYTVGTYVDIAFIIDLTLPWENVKPFLAFTINETDFTITSLTNDAGLRAKAIEKKCNSIQFGDEVTNIANSVFNAKTSFNETSPLQTIKFTGEKSVSIGNSAFANNLSIYKITSSGSTLDFTSIGTGAFAYCYNLQGFAVSTTITAINNYVSNNGASRPFYRCKLTYDGVNNIQSITSTGAGLLRKVNFSNGTYGLGVAFSYSAGSYYRPACGLLAGYIVMTGLTSGGSSHANDWTYHNGITVLDCGTFNGCNYWKNDTYLQRTMVAGNSYPGIKRAYGDGGFDGCKNLETIATFNNLTYMLPAAFRDCYKLNTTIPITAATSLIVPGYDTNQWVWTNSICDNCFSSCGRDTATGCKIRFANGTAADYENACSGMAFSSNAFAGIAPKGIIYNNQDTDINNWRTFLINHGATELAAAGWTVQTY